MSKNPFELRSDMLSLAKSYMDKQVAMNIEYAEKLGALGMYDSKEYIKAFKPYTFEELMAKAKEMYSFVSTKDTKE
jgi:hypothetical protein